MNTGISYISKAGIRIALLLTILMMVLSAGVPASHAAGPAETLTAARAAREEGDTLAADKRYDAAIDAYRRSLALFEEAGNAHEMAVLRHQLGFALLNAGEDKAALELFKANQDYHRARNDRDSLANYLLYAGKIHVRLEKYDDAERALTEAETLSQEKPIRRAEILHWLVTAYEQEGDLDIARDMLRHGRDVLATDHVQQYLGGDLERLLPGDTGAWHLPERAAWWAAGALLAAVPLWLYVRKRRIAVVAGNVALLAISLTIALGIAELVLRTVAPPVVAVRHFLHAPNRVSEFRPAPGIMPGVDYTRSRFTANEAGIRGDALPPEGVYRILTIGGSSTESLFIDDSDAWPHVLQVELQRSGHAHVWVGNAGKSGLNSFSHAVQAYFQITELKPDLVIVNAGINDLNQCISGGRRAVTDNARAIRHDDYFTNYRKNVFELIEPLPTYTGLYRLQLVRLTNRVGARLFDDTSRPAQRFAHAVQDQSGLFYVGQRARRQAARKESVAPDIDECLAAFDYNLRRVVTLARERSAKLVFATQGSLYRHDLTADEENLLWFGAQDENPFSPNPPRTYYTSAVMADLLTAYNRVTLSICTTEKLACFDTDRAVMKTTGSYYDDVHLNIAGSHALGSALARFLDEKNLIGNTAGAHSPR